MLSTLKYMYIFLLLLTLIYKLRHYYLLYRYIHYRKIIKFLPKPTDEYEVDWPVVTIQLPIYNEGAIVNDSVRAISRLDYPVSKLHIQLLDDSTDNTATVLRDLTHQLRKNGFDVEYIHRDNRDGYKAGALANGLLTAKGDYIGVFDADFLPDPQWLKLVLVCFMHADKLFNVQRQVGMVQTNWNYYNSERNVITWGASSLMDAMFKVRKVVKAFEHCPVSFAGSSGMFLKECLLDVGGWNSAAVVEDTDLSFRIQHRNKYETIYANSIVCSAMLPDKLREFRQQQFRWTYGTHVSLLKELSIAFKQRKYFEVLFSLVNWSTVHLVEVFLMFVGATLLFFDKALILSLVSFIICIPYGIEWGYYYVASKYERSTDSALRHALVVPFLGVASAFHNSLAVIMGTFKLPIEFMRTSRSAFTKTQQKYFQFGEWATSFAVGMILLQVAYSSFYRLLHVLASTQVNVVEYMCFFLCTVLGVLYTCAFFVLRE